MAAISVSPFSALRSISTLTHPNSVSIPIPCPTVSFRNVSVSFKRLSTLRNTRSRSPTILRSAEEETLIPAEEQVPEEEATADQQEQPVSVPVSPSDTLTMFFQVPRF
jgi:hypothetical protein